MDGLYGEFCDQIKKELKCKLDYKTVIISHGLSNKRRRVKKPWWTDMLTEVWNVSCDAEREWSKAVRVEKIRLKANMRATQNVFDKHV